MKGNARKGIWVVVIALVGMLSLGVMYSWTDETGNHMTDRIEKLPDKYRPLARIDADHYVTPDGIGFERDKKGNYRFFDHSSPAKKATKRTPPPPPNMGLVGGSPVSQEQYQEIKRRYAVYGGEPVPQVDRFRVKRIINPETFEIDNGQKVAFIGIDFPDELGSQTPIYREVMDYERRLMENKTVALLYGPQRYDDKGRLLAYVFIGTDMFVNADLIMNGYVKVKVVEPNVEYRTLFTRLETFARKSMLGIWGTGEEIPGAEEMDKNAR